MRIPISAGLVTLALGVATSPAFAADLEAGATLAADCSACHGPAGVSVAGQFPNLAAQKSDYVQAQLSAFRAGDRKNPLMNAIAASLSDTDIENLAAHFASLPGAAPGAVAENVTALTGQKPRFPGNWESDFTRYKRIDFPDRKQVRYYRANAAAMNAAKAGADFPNGAYLFVEIFGAKTDDSGTLIKGDDGKLVETELKAFTAMEKQAGWGDDVPNILRNDTWRYAVFSTAGEPRGGLNEAGCLACHKPLTNTDYAFTYDDIKAFAQAN